LIESSNANINLDRINQGTSNRFIADGKYTSDLSIEGSLTAANIVIDVDNSTSDILRAYSNEMPVFVINKYGYIGNVDSPKYNIDISGTIRSSVFKGSGELLHNVNLSDKSTSELEEGCNLYFTDSRAYAVAERALIAASNMFKLDVTSYSNFSYVFDTFKEDVTNNVANIISDVQNTIDNINDINTLVSTELISLKNALNNLNLDNIYQGSNFQYIVNNMINSSLLVNGTLTVKDIRILDVDGEFYDILYNSNLLKGYNSNYSRYEGSALDTQNVSNIALSTATRVAKNYCNVLQKEFDTHIARVTQNIVGLSSSIADLSESQYHISLDKVVQGDKNKYVVNDIYNSSLIVNGTLTVRDIRIIELDNDYYDEVYNSNLYDPGIYTQPAYSIATNISNIATQIVGNVLDQQTGEINLLKNSVQTLTESLSSALERITALENMLSTL
jgi:hypothetical protein